MPLYFNAQKNKEKRSVFSNGYFGSISNGSIYLANGRKHPHANLGPLRVPASVISTLVRPSLGTASLIGWVAHKDEFAII